MSTSIHERTDREELLAGELRTIALHTIQNRDPEDVRSALGLARSGLERLLAEKNWDLRVAFRVVDCLEASVVEALIKSANDR